jgi:hemerythrin-like domain-containing protein
MDTGATRRGFLYLAGGIAAGIAIPAVPSTLRASEKKEGTGKQAVVNPVEDLMREHGILRRVLLIYDEAAKLLDSGKSLPPGVIEDSASIIQHFVQNYHEKLEEEEIFPRFQKARKFDDLVSLLFTQHQAGRRLTDSILQLTQTKAVKTIPKPDTSPAVDQIYGGTPFFQRAGVGSPAKLTLALHQFINMYRPHAAWEDTVLYPAFRSVVSPSEFDELGDRFEEREMRLFGKDGFEKVLDSVGEIEKKMGIHDLSKFTPSI